MKKATLRTLRATMRKFRPRFLRDGCESCPCFELTDTDKYSSKCDDVCGAIWTELSEDYHVICPCLRWGKEEATRRLNLFVDQGER